jgi:hypothetical protein
LSTAIPPQEGTNGNYNSKQERLNHWRHDQHSLGSTMAQGDMGQIEQRRSVRWACVHDLEHGLKVTIQINCRPRVSLEDQQLIAVIPPSVWDAMWEPYGFARSKGQSLTIDLRRQGARSDHSLFILDVMNVQRRALPMRRQGAPNSQHHFPVALLTPDLQNLTGVPAGQPQSRRTCRHWRFIDGIPSARLEPRDTAI